MENVKPWWQSRTIWSGLLLAIYVVLASAGVLPPGISEGAINEIVTVVLALAAVIFRTTATTAIGAPTA